MAKQKVIQTNFTGGEMSPQMLGRVDTVKYQNGAALISNMIVRPQGGVFKREGSYFVKEVKTSAKATVLIEFEYSDLQPYVLEMGEYYFRIYYDGGFVETAPSSGVPLEVTTLYTESELADITHTQSADVLYLFHPNHVTQKIKRLGANSWSIEDCNFQDGPYITNQDTETILRITDYTSVADAVATSAIFTSTPTSKVISSVTKVGSDYVFTTSTAHGWATATVVSLSHIWYAKAASINPVWVKKDGAYAITSLSANTFKITNPPLFPTYTLTWDLTGALAQTHVAPEHFEYKKQNEWRLAKILTITDTTHAKVLAYDNIKTGLTKLGPIVLSGSNITLTYSGVFTQADVGKYIRTTAGVWYQIATVVDDSAVTVGSSITKLGSTPDPIFITVSTAVQQGHVTSNSNVFVSTDINRHIRFNFGGQRPWGIITSYISATQVDVLFQVALPTDPNDYSKLYDDGTTSLWQLGSWSETTGYPRTGCFHEQRLWFGGTVTEPITVWASQISDYENMAPTDYDSVVVDTCAINYAVVANKANPIQWLASGNTLLIGTQGSEWQVKSGSSITQPITPTNISISPQTVNGSLKRTRPIRLGSVLAFIQKAGKKLIELVFDYQQDSFVSRNMNIVSEHILRRNKTTAFLSAYQQEPNNIIWVCLRNGTLAACTYDRDQQVMAWHQHALGGNGIVESMVAVNSTSGEETLLYMIVKRTIGGATKRYIEYFVPIFDPIDDNDIESAYFLDCGLTYDGAPTATVSGASHLNGESVSVVADGVYIGEKTVTAGVISLGLTASVVHIGYKYTSTLKTLPQEGGSPSGGTAQGKAKRIARTMIRVLNTRDFKYGTTLQNLDEKKVVDGNGVPVNKLTTDDLGVNVPMNYNYTAQVYYVQDKPYPFVVLAIAPDVEVTT